MSAHWVVCLPRIGVTVMNVVSCARGVVLVIALLVASDFVDAEQPQLRLVTVTGQSEVRVVPDEVVVTVGVETLDLDIELARADSDERVKKVFEITNEHGIEPRHVGTDRVSIRPKYRWYGQEKRDFLGYEVRQTIAIRLSDLSKYEALLTALLKVKTGSITIRRG